MPTTMPTPTIVRCDKARLALLPHADEPFPLIGRLIPLYDGKTWQYTQELFDRCAEKTYPPEEYNAADYVDNPDQAAFLALDGDALVGSIRVRKRWNGNGFIEDLKVNRSHRGKGIGTMLVDAAIHWCRENRLNGLSLETQDNNLLACRFYLKNGFVLGGMDNRIYTHSLCRGEIALYFYYPEERL